MELRNTPAKDLDKFIEAYLLPNRDFCTKVKYAINTICSFLKERCFRDNYQSVWVSKVVKGGSSGKGTTIKDQSDADLVVFLSPLTSFENQFRFREKYIKEIKKQLEACQRERKFDVEFEIQSSELFSPRSLSFTLRSPQLREGVKFDVLPAFDALGQRFRDYTPDPQVYVRLIRECTNLQREGEFSTCFTELQRDFLKQRPTKLKSLIRLVKHWYQLCLKRIGKPLPQQYALELLTVYAWERGSRETEFSTAEGFQTVLKLIIKYQYLCIYWTVYYNFENPDIKEYLNRQINKPRPVILDPADPTGNLGGNPHAWSRLASEAEAWLSHSCFKKQDGSPVGSWNVLVEES
ncbi:2'-5'-oligoadenylate synthase 1 isoform X2 [Cynocephalus volans]|uniref:2'-5'-oligoadenylate synthase 1 isoform X2 n=1 Tax=Cynocephalus volans TaxID=110931 RepID=UPI002FCC8FD6